MSTRSLAYLKQDELECFNRDGYLIIPDFLSSSKCHDLLIRANQLLEQLDLSNHPRTIFKTAKLHGPQTTDFRVGKDDEKETKQEPAITTPPLPPSASSSNTVSSPPPVRVDREHKNDYFLSTADQIGYFFEEGAFDKETGELLVDKTKAINKIAHNLHGLDPLFQSVSFSKSIKDIARDIGFIYPVLLQSMVIFKQPRIGGIVDKHRDSTFLYTIPSSAVGFWFALEDCTLENGCLWFVPGSHRDQASNKRMKREGDLTTTINNLTREGRIQGKRSIGIGAPNNIGVQLTFVGEDKREYEDSEFISAQVSKGSLILIHGDVVHYSAANKSEKSRNIYTFHLIEDYQTRYPEENWLQWEKEFPRLFSTQEEQQATNNKEQMS